ncbi:MAG: IS1 family transposase, partial [Magnetococcales bacterium]|nr:IS1 family transposase [Magnetococcales bacterium]
VKYGKQPNGSQRYRCMNPDCERQVFLLDYSDRKRMPEIKRQIIEMALDGKDIRETARILNVSPASVIEVYDQLAEFGRHYDRMRFGQPQPMHLATPALSSHSSH